MKTPKELAPADFTDRLSSLFYKVLADANIAFLPDHFFPKWREYMEMGFARTWETDGAVLGALFTDDIFSGKLRANVVFWFAWPGVRHGSITRILFETFETAAKQAGCADIQSSAHIHLTPAERTQGYLKHGFNLSETVFTKTL